MTLTQHQAHTDAWQPDDFDLEPQERGIDGSRDQARLLTRIQRAADLRIGGAPWHRVADVVGYASAGAACTAVLGYLRRQANESVAALRDLESARYDAAAMAIFPKVASGDPRAQDTWLRNRAAYRALHGLNAPLQVTLSSGAQAALADALGDAEQLVMGLVTDRRDDPIPTDDPTPGWDGS